MITYRANIHKYAPELSTIEEVECAKVQGGWRIEVLRDKRIPNASSVIYDNDKLQMLLNKEFFEEKKNDKY